MDIATAVWWNGYKVKMAEQSQTFPRILLSCSASERSGPQRCACVRVCVCVCVCAHSALGTHSLYSFLFFCGMCFCCVAMLLLCGRPGKPQPFLPDLPQVDPSRSVPVCVCPWPADQQPGFCVTQRTDARPWLLYSSSLAPRMT